MLIHLMSAGRLQLFDTRASLRDRTSRLLVRLDDGRELRLREFGTKQRGLGEAAARRRGRRRGDDRRARPRGLARPAAVRRAARRAAPAVRAAARPARDRRDRPLVGRRDPARGDDLAVQARLGPRAPTRPQRLREATVAHAWRRRSPTTRRRSRCRSPTSCRCRSPSTAATASRARAAATALEAVFYEDYVMCYCPTCQTEGKLLKDRRLSRLLK